MANLRRNLSALSQFLKRILQRAKPNRRSELMHAVRGGMFRRLEPRRVLSVNATLNAGVLDISILSNDADTTAVLRSASDTEFFVDTNSNAVHDGSELRALFSELRQLNVSGDGHNTAFFWRDNFAAASMNLANAGGNVLSVNSVNSFESIATVSLQGNASIAADESIKLGGDLSVAGNLRANALDNNSSLSTLATAKLNVTGTTQFSANAIVLDGSMGNFNDLATTSAAGTTVSGTIVAEDIDMKAYGLLHVKFGGSIDATTLNMDAIGANSDIRIDGQLTSTGNMELHAHDSLLLSSTSNLSVNGSGNLLLFANSDNSNGDGNDSIEMLDGASIATDTGSILLFATGKDAGDLRLSTVSTDSTSATAVAIRAEGNIVDGTAAETANILAANGTVVLNSLQGALGGADDIDIDATNLIFNAAPTSAGVVNITDLAGGVRVSGASQAGGGGSLIANSPLTISANINVGASMIFTAGNSAAAGDTLTIDNKAVVTLSSASAASLSFYAGDDIVFRSGRIVSAGGTHNVILAADLDHAGVGTADGDRGIIAQDGLLGIEVTTHHLTATAATGIDLDTAIDKLTANTSSTGNIRIREQDAITLIDVATANGAITITASGTINAIHVSTAGTDSDSNDVRLNTTGAGDMVVHSILAGPTRGDVTLTSHASILDGDAVDDLDISGNDVNLSAGGNIGGTSSDVFKGLFYPIEVNATGDLIANALAGDIAINANVAGTVSLSAITAYVASTGDIFTASVLAVTNLALIADADDNGVGALFLGPTLAVAGDLRVEGADIVASDGSIDLAADRLLMKSQQSETLSLSASILDATTYGNLIVNSIRAVELLDIDCDNVALQTLSPTGFIQLNATGSILVSDDVIAGNDAIASSSGSVTLQANGVASNLIVNGVVLTDRGDLILRADNDILIGAAPSASDVTTGLNARVRSLGGNITLIAHDDVKLLGDIETEAAFVYVRADNLSNNLGSGITMGANATVRNHRGTILFEADNESDIVLGFVDTIDTDFSAGSVSLQSTGSILDGKGELRELNIQTGILRLVADSNDDRLGTIGLSSPGNGFYLNAIDTQVQVLAAVSAEGIYIRELDGLSVSASGDVSAEPVRFNSSSTTITHSTLSDLKTTSNGNVVLVSESGNIIITDSDGDFSGVSAHGQGNILLLTSDSMGDDIRLEANVLSENGQITISAGRNIELSATIATGRQGAGADVQLRAFSGFIDEGPIEGEQAKVIASSLQLLSAKHAHLHDVEVDQLTAHVGENGLLKSWQNVNSRVSQRGDDFLLEALGPDRVNFVQSAGVLTQVDTKQGVSPAHAAEPQGNVIVNAPSNNPRRSNYDDVTRLHRFEDAYASQYALFLKNSKSLDVQTVTAGSSANPNIYIETTGTASDLLVTKEVSTGSTSDREGGIVLIAGRELQLVGELKTVNSLRTQLINEIGDATASNIDQFEARRSVLNATIYNGGEGLEPQMDFTSTQFVIRLNSQSRLYEDYRTHIYQRVVANAGFAGESGLMSYVGYADGNVQQFDVAGEIGIRDGQRSQLNLNDQTSIQAALAPSQAIVLSRSIAFANALLDSNQKLPTVAIIRRADDFFLFENATAVNAEGITDLTVEFQAVNEVGALGARGAMELPVDPLAPAMPEPVKMGLTNPMLRATDLLTEEIEFVAPVTGEIEVAIYRVFYDDKDNNGQPDQSELPSPDEVKAASIADEADIAAMEENDSEALKQKRYKLAKPLARTVGTPTAEDIDELKQRLMDDPQLKTGVYSIIQKEVDGKEVVLDVFSIRDWDEIPSQDQPLIQLPKSNGDATEGESQPKAEPQIAPSATESSRLEFVPESIENRVNDSRPESRFASVGFIASSLWMIRQSKLSDDADNLKEKKLQPSASERPSSFSRQARRARKLGRLK